jgi:hypothetical protein
LFITVDNRDEAAELINEDITNIQSWADQWLIEFSAVKTKSLLVSNKGTPNDHPNLVIQDQVIKSVSEHKHLGVVLSHNLRWNAHINDVVTRCTKKINMMKKFKFELDKKSLETIYLSFIRPTIEYGDILFAGTYDSDLCKLDRLQVDAMRVVTGATEKSNIALLYEDLDWISLEQRRNHHCLALLYKVLNGQAPRYLYDLLPQRPQRQGGRNLRSNENELLPVPFTRTETFRSSFVPFCIRLWNKLDKKLRDSPTLDSFKSALKGQKTERNKLYYFGKRLPAIHHARLRIGCSKLNAHLCLNLHVVPSPQCQCGSPLEDPTHFFFSCPALHAQRQSLLRSVALVSNNINLNTLLKGDPDISFEDNKLLFEAVHTFITDSHRFY